MSDTNTDQEPTMEEILASIRRIISEDSGDEEARAEHAPAPRHAAAEVLELTEAMIADDGARAGATPEPEPTPEPAAPAAAEEPAETGERLASPAAAARASDAFAALASAVNADGEVALDGGSGRSLEALAKELLRPMLKDWLDRNLPQLVERLVAAEIARLSSRSDDQ